MGRFLEFAHCASHGGARCSDLPRPRTAVAPQSTRLAGSAHARANRFSVTLRPGFLSNQNFSGPLLVSFPVGLLQFDLRVLGAGLPAAFFVQGSRYNLMLARRGIFPVEIEKAPSVLVAMGSVDVRRDPG